MNRIKLFILPGVLIGVLAVLFMRTSGIQAAPASSCGSWSIVNSPNAGSTSTFNAVAAVSANDVWAVGHATGFKPLIENWNGTQWRVVASPDQKIGGILNGLSVISANDIWAVGRDNSGDNGKGIAMHWNGTKWSLINTPNPQAGSALYGVAAVSTNDVWATGLVDQTTNGANYGTLVEHWDGTKWKIVASPTSLDDADTLRGISVVSANNIWAVGSVDSGVSGALPEIEHWNGTQWSMVTPPASGPNSSLESVAALSAKNIWVVGTANNGTLIEHYDGTSWSIVSSPNVGTGSNFLASVAAVSAQNIWTVGNYANSSSVNRTLVEHWNGTSWSIVQSPNSGTSNNILSGITHISGTSHVWAVGAYGPSFTTYKTLTEFHC
jgi:hypothetical protein